MKKILAIVFSVVKIQSIYASEPSYCKAPSCENKGKWYFEAGLLLEQARVSNSLVALHHYSGDGTSQPLRTDDTIRYTFDVDPGLRLALGYETNHDNWLFSAGFEWMSTEANVEESISGGVSSGGDYRASDFPYIFYGTNTTSPILFQKVNASLNIDYFLLDVCLNKGTIISNYVSYEPFIGLEASWIYYNASRSMLDDASTTPTIMPANTSFLETSNVNFWGVGPMAGTEANYAFRSGWGIFSIANVAVLFGNNNLLNRSGFVTTQTVPLYDRTTDQSLVISPTIRGIFGINYKTTSFCGEHLMGFKLGMDARIYFNQYPVILYRASEAYSSSSTRLNSFPTIIDNGTFGMIGAVLDFNYLL